VPPAFPLLEPAALAAAVAPLALAEPDPSAAAFIQYTSGSTGAPKGVVVTHANVLANCHAIRDATGYTRADRMVSWLPLHHDMGLVGGLLTSIYCAAETWLMPPMAFLARPVTWLEAISRFRATLTVGPTFAYALCARKIPDKQLAGLDLSALRLAYVGAEPVDATTLEAFVGRFSAYGLSPRAMYPVYGLAEATLAVAFPEPGCGLHVDTVDRVRLASDGVAAPAAAGDPGAVRFVSVGQALPRHRIEIVSPETGDRLGERRVGELVVDGASVTPCYFGHAGAASRTRLFTGDLAYHADGRVFIVDRIKDLVIVAGQNYAPSDIEVIASGVDGVRRGRVVAFSTPGTAGTEELHIVAEASLDAWRPPDQIADEVRRRVRHDVGLSAATVTVVAPGSLPRTSSGKMQRRACVELHRSHALQALRSRTDVLAARWARGRDRALGRAAFAARGVLAWVGAVRRRVPSIHELLP
jgi:acyl-CoA synthetase (AMP-forming)/AMP-acid ligase II